MVSLSLSLYVKADNTNSILIDQVTGSNNLDLTIEQIGYNNKIFFSIGDIDDTVIAEPVLMPGDASFTLYGGHTYQILEDDTIVYEYKTGPYEGQELDKKFIKND